MDVMAKCLCRYRSHGTTRIWAASAYKKPQDCLRLFWPNRGTCRSWPRDARLV